jgi:diguanylate cyclase (GGDEF)-like protein
VQLQERLEHAVHEAGDSGHFCVLTINVERFREVQTGLGIRAADGLLQQIAMRLRQAATGELIARVTADEFAIFVEHDGTELATALAQRVHDVMNPPFEQAGVAIDVQVRIGAALYPDHGKDADTLLLHSAIAAREAASSPTHFAAYRGVSELQSTHRLELAAELRRAIPAGQLMLFYQPKIDVLRGVVCGVEALVRWAHPVRGMVRPDEFIGLAEHTGLIKPLTSWVIEAAMRQAARWQAEGMPLPIAINVSAVNLREPDFLDRLGELQLQTGCEPRLIQLEITETTLMQDPNSLDLLHRLKHMGIDIYIDDFGTGYSSLSYIATMPVHALKIDRSFVLNMTRKEEHRTVVAAAISLAHSLHLRVVGEGVETIQQAHELERLDCDELQGYLFARPLPPDELARWIGQFDPSAYELTRATPASS